MEELASIPPLPTGGNVRITASLEPDAYALLEALCRRLYPTRRASRARALVIEQAIRMFHRRVIDDAGVGEEE